MLPVNQIRIKKSAKNREYLNTCDLMKCLALAIMFIDHAGFYFFREHEVLRAIGRASAPIWLFFVGYFYHHRDTQKIYALAFIDYPLQQVFLSFYGAHSGFNILMTIIVSRLVVQKIMPYRSKRSVLLLIALLLIGSNSATAPIIEYGTVMTLFALVGALKKEGHEDVNFFMLAAFIAYGLIEQDVFKFSLHNQIVEWCALFMTFFLLKNYKLKPVAIPYKNMSKVGMWLSIHSLTIYFVHVNLFRLAGLVIDLTLR